MAAPPHAGPGDLLMALTLREGEAAALRQQAARLADERDRALEVGRAAGSGATRSRLALP